MILHRQAFDHNMMPITWREFENTRIEVQARLAILENAKMARDFLDKLNGDFHSHNRSVGQLRRWANYRRIHESHE